MEKIRVFTAFSGYDSQCLALDKLGVNYDLVGWSEIDKYAIKAHNILFPQYKDRNYGDISKIDWSQVPDFDLFTYSSPCQDFSRAGIQRGGEEGSNTRSSLLWECRKAILSKKPKYLLLENVEALVSKKFINLFNRWISELGDYGYTSYWQVLNGINYGIPHNRSRVFLVSILRDENEKYPVYNFPKNFPLEKKLKDILENTVDNKFFLKKENVDKVLYKEDKKNSKDKDVLEPLKIIEATKKGYAEASVGDSVDICRLSCHSRRGRVGKGVVNTLTCSCDMGTVVKCEYEEKGVKKYEYRIRKLTPKECFRLMGVDEESIKKIQESNQISDIQQYKLAGNSIIIDVLENIFKKLFVDKDNDYGHKALF
jgi:DNA (cytosine-5)-methyltransferase 1